MDSGQVDVEWKGIHETKLNRNSNGSQGGSNPFTNLLSTTDLLNPEPVAVEEPSEPEVELPTSGDADAWKRLAGLLEELPEIDKTALGQKGAEIDLTKKNLNDKLGLGLEGRRVRRAWDVALERLVECGFLAAKDGGYILASREVEEKEEEAPTGQRSAELQKIHDRFVTAMAQLLEEDD